MSEKGTLYLCSIRDLSMYSVLDHKYFISRYIEDATSIKKYGFIQVKDLSPSEKLVKEYLRSKDKKEWGKHAFKTWYEPEFKKEIKTVKELRDALNKVYKILKSGQDVALACYCYDVNLCHRVIIGEEFAKLGFSVNVR